MIWRGPGAFGRFRRRHRIMTTLTKGMTATKSFGSQPQALTGAVCIDRLLHICRAGGREPAGLAYPGTDKVPVKTDRRNQNLANHDRPLVSERGASARAK